MARGPLPCARWAVSGPDLQNANDLAAPLRTLDGRRLVAGGRQAPTTGDRRIPARVPSRGWYSDFGEFPHFPNLCALA